MAAPVLFATKLYNELRSANNLETYAIIAEFFTPQGPKDGPNVYGTFASADIIASSVVGLVSLIEPLDLRLTALEQR